MHFSHIHGHEVVIMVTHQCELPNQIGVSDACQSLMGPLAQVVRVGKVQGLEKHGCDQRQLGTGKRENAESTLKAQGKVLVSWVLVAREQ